MTNGPAKGFKGSPLDELEEILREQRVASTPATADASAASAARVLIRPRTGETRALSSILEEIHQRQLRRVQRLGLAPASSEDPETTPASQLIRFAAASRSFAVPMPQIAEIADRPKITLVPGLPSFLPGVANFRGEVVAVFDLGVFLDASRVGKARRSLLLHGEHREVVGAVLIDAVHGVAPYHPHDLAAAPAEEAGPLDTCKLGNFDFEDHSYSLVDLLTFLQSDELKAHLGVRA